MRKILSLFLIFFLLCSPCYAERNKPPLGSQIKWGHPLIRGLVGCWLMNEGGGAKTANLINGKRATLTLLPWRSGKQGIGLDFEADVAHSLLITGLQKDIPAAKTKTVSCWVCPESLAASAWILAAQNDYIFVLRDADPIDTIAWSDGAAWYECGVAADLGVWQMITWVVNSSFNCTVYKNGIKIGSDLISGRADALDGSMAIGRNPGGANRFDGQMSNMLVYERALTPSEIQQLYIDPYCFIKRPSLLDWFKLEEGGAVDDSQVFFISMKDKWTSPRF